MQCVLSRASQHCFTIRYRRLVRAVAVRLLLTVGVLAGCAASRSEHLAPPPVALSENTRIVLVARDEVRQGFALSRLRVELDGAEVFTSLNFNGVLSQGVRFHDAAIAPGQHLFEVQMLYVGTGEGDAVALAGYRFKLSSRQSFEIKADERLEVVITSYEKRWVTPEKRLAIRYDIRPVVGR